MATQYRAQWLFTTLAEVAVALYRVAIYWPGLIDLCTRSKKYGRRRQRPWK